MVATTIPCETNTNSSIWSLEAELQLKNNEIKEQKVKIDTFSIEVNHWMAQFEQDRQSAKIILQHFGIDIQGSVGCYMIIK